MKHSILTAIAASLLFTTAASAADLAARPYTKAPPPVVAVYDWTGFYVGGHLGGAWTNEQWINTANTTAFGDLSPGQGFSQRGSGVFGGGQIGYNWQVNNFVLGLEGTISGMGNKGTVVNTVFGAGLDDVFSWRTNWMATVVGRAGVAFNNNLLYVKGGYAGVNNRLSVSDTVGTTGSGSQTTWHNGWTVGAGWEYGITRNWIVGVEYDYAAFETKSYQLAGAAAPAVYTFDVKPKDIQSVVARLSYKFGAPVVAKY
ncbi:outer membrane protein [Bradyrhizobium centrosematis]|uniref:outer membrane protein n=1 Tax=Bradyrhizobium centrosematis TaxID=1300039 RepID=UPI00388CFD51